MSKNGSKIREEQVSFQPTIQPRRGWISQRAGLVSISVISVVLGGLVASQVVPVYGWAWGLRYALIFAAAIWAVFFVVQVLLRLVRR